MVCLSGGMAKAQETSKTFTEMTMAKCDDGTSLKGDFISYPAGFKSAFYSDDLPYIRITDNESNTRIYDFNTLQTISEVKAKQGEFSQLTRDGYVTIKPSSFVKDDNVPTFYRFDNTKVWTCKNDLVVADRVNNVAVCCKVPSAYSWRRGNMVAYDLQTGRELWQATIPQNMHFAWGDFLKDKAHPQTYYLMADSLVRLNILTGERQTLPFAAGVKEPMKSILSVVKGRLPSSVDWLREANYSFDSMIAPHVLTGTHSNWVVSGDTIWVADARQVYALTRDLRLIWATPIPDGIGAKSELKLDGNRLLMVSFGSAFQNGYIGRCGKPFMASYDKSTGRQMSFQAPTIESKLVGGTIVPGRAYWQDDKGFYYTDEGENEAHRIDWKPKTDRQPNDGYPDRAIHDTVYVMRNQRLEPIVTDAQQLVVELYGQDVYIVHADGSAEMLKADEVFYHNRLNLYTNNELEMRRYVLVKPGTQEVEQAFTTNGRVTINKQGDMVLSMKYGVGIIRKQP